MQVLNIFHVLIAIAMVAFILIQRGAGATAGAAFGSGASGTVFGSRGAGSFLSRSTWVLATLFCLISLTMAVVVSRTIGVPETDLGVVGSPAAIEQPAVEIPAPLPLTEDASDLPAMDDAAGSADDVPAMDNGMQETSAEGETEPADDSDG